MRDGTFAFVGIIFVFLIALALLVDWIWPREIPMPVDDVVATPASIPQARAPDFPITYCIRVMPPPQRGRITHT